MKHPAKDQHALFVVICITCPHGTIARIEGTSEREEREGLVWIGRRVVIPMEGVSRHIELAEESKKRYRYTYICR